MKRVAIYARVSTDFESQKTSIPNTIAFFTEYINQQKDWICVENYIDEGISGKSTKNRLGFLQMFKDAQMHKFDILLLKNIKRFGRNQRDSLNYIGDLHDLGIRVISFDDKIDTETDMHMVGLHTWLAEIDLRGISSNQKMRIKLYQDTGLFSSNRRPFGYKIEKHVLIPIEEEAVIVKKIYNMYLDGNGTYRILEYLKNCGVNPVLGKEWTKTTVIIILTNPNYTGNLFQKRSTRKEVIDKSITKFDKKDWVEARNTHEAIINEETFNKVQEMRKERKELNDKNVRHSNATYFSNVLICGRCGASYVRKKVHGKLVYSCEEYERWGTKGKCKTREAISEDDLLNFLDKYIQKLRTEKSMLKGIYDNCVKSICSNDKSMIKRSNTIDTELVKENNKSNKLLELVTGGIIGNEQYKLQNNDVQNRITSLNIEKKQIEYQLLQKNNLEIKFKEFQERLLGLERMKEWNNQTIKEFFSKIIIYDKENTYIKLFIEEY